MVRGDEAVRLERGGDGVGVPTEDGGHRRGLERGGVRHRPAAFGDEGDGVGRLEDPGDPGGGELADRVAGDPAHEGTAAVGEQGVGRDETGGDDERLRERRVLDGLGVGLGAVGGEVDADGLGPRPHAVTDGGVLEPGGEEAGGLGALSGRDDDDHRTILPVGPRRTRVGFPQR
ncbi:hypothetical protein QE359_002388 [Curtobacterium sp. SORGH_AS776]|nr:hypothetical protein [Curtobacterium sp. SORGH_AS_0776]